MTTICNEWLFFFWFLFGAVMVLAVDDAPQTDSGEMLLIFKKSFFKV
jgi:hypothetical protein